MREYQKAPRYELITRYGRMVVAVNGATAVYLDASQNFGADESIGLIVRGIRYAVSAHLQLKDGQWGLFAPDHAPHLAFQSLFVDRGRGDVSRSARLVVQEAVLEACTQWVADHPDALTEGERIRRNNEAERLEKEIEKLENNLVESRKRLTALEEGA